MALLPPGLAYVAPGALKACATCGIVYALQRFQSVVPLPRWAAFLALPAYLLLRPWFDWLLEERERRKLGGARIPVTQGSLPGNFDLLRQIMRIRENGYFGEFVPHLVNEYGNTYNLKVIGVNQVFTAQPDNVKAILATDFPSFEKGSRMDHATAAVLGSGVFNADGEMWKFHRQISRPFFHRERISDFDIFARHADSAIAAMLARAREGVPVDLQDLTGRFTLDSATEFLFGACVHALASPLPRPGEIMADGSRRVAPGAVLSRADEFVRAFNQAQVVISNRLWVGPIWPLYEFWQDKTKEPMKVIDAFIDPILAQALSKKKERVALGELAADDKEEAATLLDHLVMHTDDAKVIKDEIMNISVAGRDTTSATLTFASYFLAMHPNVMARLRQEVLNKFGRDRLPTYDDLRDMKYLRAFINETLRLMPPVPFNVRQAVKGVLLPSKNQEGKHHYMPKGTSISWSTWYMHRRTDFWGPDAEQFDPDRFLDERVRKYVTPNPFIFLPFNAGPRICLGQQFAYNEVSFFLVRMLQRVRALELAPEAQIESTRVPEEWAGSPGRKGVERMRPASHLTLYSKGGLWFKIVEA
ncbi:CYP63 cytochrome P450 monooxygenase-like protein [Auricularia subglabra TFB-10046 SS5]|nr:CYP63 cytochrome P450 monooxygenase-like protein [Auricularia subglabra TFB-10046 SS5]